MRGKVGRPSDLNLPSRVLDDRERERKTDIERELCVLGVGGSEHLQIFSLFFS